MLAEPFRGNKVSFRKLSYFTLFRLTMGAIGDELAAPGRGPSPPDLFAGCCAQIILATFSRSVKDFVLFDTKMKEGGGKSF
jgi:hypothetical protein